MGFFSLTVLPPPMSALTLRRFSPFSTPLSHKRHHRRPLRSTTLLSLIHYPPRASLSSNDPTESEDDEDQFQSKNVPEDYDDRANSPTNDAILNETNLNSSAFSSDESSKQDSAPFSSSYTSPVNNVVALGFENDRRQQQQLGETLAALSQSLALLSSTLTEVSSAVGVLSAALTSAQLQSAPSSTYLSPPERRDLREAEARGGAVDPPEPWDNIPDLATASAAPQRLTGGDGNSRDEEDTIPPYLVEQNRKAHKLAYRLQQAFVQARIEGLGKPFQVAVEEFAEACMASHTLGIGLKELQLQLVLQDGSLTGAFAIRNQRWSDEPILNDESRIRSFWVRLVYATLAQLEPTENKDLEVEPIDSYVKQVLNLALEEGYDFERLKLEQTFTNSETSSGAVKAMRENQYLILLTLEKAKNQNK